MEENKDIFFMNIALKLAKRALDRNEVPIGAVLVDQNGKILGRGYNRVEAKKNQIEHAEIIAINKACKKIADWRLDGATLYVTLEPCIMCFGLIYISRIKRIVFGAKSEFVGSCLQILKNNEYYIKNLIIEGGLKEQESLDILRLFFKKLRKKGKVRHEAES